MSEKTMFASLPSAFGEGSSRPAFPDEKESSNVKQEVYNFHLKEEDDKSNVKKVKKETGEIETEEEEEEKYFCPVCDHSSYSFEAFQEHSVSQQHVERAARVFHRDIPTKKQTKDELKDKEVHHCEICDINCNGDASWTAHLQGAKHKKKEKQKALEDEIRRAAKERELPQGVGESIIDPVPTTMHEFMAWNEPLIGLEFITEIQTMGELPRFACEVCGLNFDNNSKFPHITGVKHRLHVIKKKDKDWAKRLQENSKKRSELVSRLALAAEKLEKREGRQRINAKYESVFPNVPESNVSDGEVVDGPSSPTPKSPIADRIPSLLDVDIKPPVDGLLPTPTVESNFIPMEPSFPPPPVMPHSPRDHSRDRSQDRSGGRSRDRSAERQRSRSKRRSRSRERHDRSSSREKPRVRSRSRDRRHRDRSRDRRRSRSPRDKERDFDEEIQEEMRRQSRRAEEKRRAEERKKRHAERDEAERKEEQERKRKRREEESRKSPPPEAPRVLDEDTKRLVMQNLTELAKCCVTNEADAELALQVSNALTQALLQYRMKNMPQSVLQTLVQQQQLAQQQQLLQQNFSTTPQQPTQPPPPQNLMNPLNTQQPMPPSNLPINPMQQQTQQFNPSPMMTPQGNNPQNNMNQMQGVPQQQGLQQQQQQQMNGQIQNSNMMMNQNFQNRPNNIPPMNNPPPQNQMFTNQPRNIPPQQQPSNQANNQQFQQNDNNFNQQQQQQQQPFQQQQQQQQNVNQNFQTQNNQISNNQISNNQVSNNQMSTNRFNNIQPEIKQEPLDDYTRGGNQARRNFPQQHKNNQNIPQQRSMMEQQQQFEQQQQRQHYQDHGTTIRPLMGENYGGPRSPIYSDRDRRSPIYSDRDRRSPIYNSDRDRSPLYDRSRMR